MQQLACFKTGRIALDGRALLKPPRAFFKVIAARNAKQVQEQPETTLLTFSALIRGPEI